MPSSSFIVFAVVYGTPSGQDIAIYLDNNPALTKLNEKAFKPVLDYFEGLYSPSIKLQIGLQNGNSIQ